MIDDDIIEQFSVSFDGKTQQLNEKTINSKPRRRRSPTQHPVAMGIVLKNPRPYPVRYYWWSGTASVYQGPIGPKSVTATNSYVGHEFYFTTFDKKSRTEVEFFRIHVVDAVNQYILPPEPGQEKDPHYIALMEEKRFVDDYQEQHGYPWLAHYPRHPPIHHMWPADHIGQKHIVTTKETHWTCIPDYDKDSAPKIPTDQAIEKCHKSAQNDETQDFVLEVISQEPRAFLIENTLSDTECDLIIQLSKPKMKRSRAGQNGGLETNTRTSSNAWLGRKAHYIIDTIYRRAADIVNISESLFVPGKKGNIVEDMQVVWYEYNEEYTPHHDFGADGRPQQRYITLLFYLTDQISEDAGGETNFPKAKDGQGMKVHPGKGSSVMFYSILPDGNADDKSLHAALPVKKGVKWLANFWVWDPER